MGVILLRKKFTDSHLDEGRQTLILESEEGQKMSLDTYLLDYHNCIQAISSIIQSYNSVVEDVFEWYDELLEMFKNFEEQGVPNDVLNKYKDMFFSYTADLYKEYFKKH